MGLFDQITGRGVEKKIAEYADIYGEVLLGMHRDLEDHRRQINALTLRCEQLRKQMIWGAAAAFVVLVLSVVIVWILHFKG